MFLFTVQEPLGYLKADDPKEYQRINGKYASWINWYFGTLILYVALGEYRSNTNSARAVRAFKIPKVFAQLQLMSLLILMAASFV